MLRISAIFLLFFSTSLFARVLELGDMADLLVDQFDNVTSLMIAIAYVAGIGFGLTAVYKFKQHKDNPTQVSVGLPFSMMAISVLLVFLPSIYIPAGNSLFGEGARFNSGSATGDLTSLPGSDQGGWSNWEFLWRIIVCIFWN